MRSSVVVIGAGHAGLAVSRRLTERSIDHVILERGEIGNSWRRERWDSLRLLTPNWQLDLPGMPYTGGDPDGYMSATDVTAHVARYAVTIDAPVITDTTVVRLGAAGDGYEVVTDRDRWRCTSVVIASGAANRAAVPAVADLVPPGIAVRTPMTYRNPDDLAPGGVLVVGASATGVQLAEEIHHSGRAVTLSVGEHVRMPRTYRGRDVFWWMHHAGILDQRYDEVDDVDRARRLPSPQLVGTPQRRTVDLNHLAECGIRVVGRLQHIAGGVAQLSGALANHCKLADLKLTRLLDEFDRWAEAAKVDDVDAPERFAPTTVAARPPLEIDLVREGITTILFATGYKPDHTWIDLPVFDRRGRIRHDGGAATDAAGVYLVGHHVLRRRRSSFISGATSDSDEICALLHRHLDQRQRDRRTWTRAGAADGDGRGAATPPSGIARRPLAPHVHDNHRSTQPT